MKKSINAVLLSLTVALTLSSCLGSSDDTEYSYYNDAAITSVALGTLNQYLTDSDGELTKSTYAGSDYKFSIDQEQGLIFNPDSLPYGTDAKHVITSIGTLNSGTLFIKNIDDDDYNYYVSTDSLDLSVERKLRVLSQSGEQYREYTLKLNVHKEDGDAFGWSSALGTDDDGNALSNADLTTLTSMKAVAQGGNIYLFGSNGTETVIYLSNENDGKNWTKCTPDVSLGADAYKSAIAAQGLLYILNGETLLCSTDAQTWQTRAENTALRQLIGSGLGYLFALSTDGKPMVSDDYGTTWTANNTEEGNDAFLPAIAEGYAYMPLKTNSDMGMLTVLGQTAGGQTVAWTKLVEENKPLAYPWTLVEGSKQTPQLASIATFGYDSAIMMLGLKDGSAKNYMISKDGGINWSTDSRYALPATLSTNAFATTVDSNNFIWLFYGDSGQIWRGRLNRMGWERQ